MGMTIDEIIKYIPAPICGETEIGPEKQKEYDAHDTAVIILRKYQKITKIAKAYKNGATGLACINEICEVIEE